jgi:hypothetical protein
MPCTASARKPDSSQKKTSPPVAFACQAMAGNVPGRYRTERTPYMREIMDAISPSHVARRVLLMKAVQADSRRRATVGSAT